MYGLLLGVVPASASFFALMALVVKGKVNINEFIDLSKSEKLLPSMFTPVKSYGFKG